MRFGRPVLALGILVSGLLHAAVVTAQERAVSFANLRFGATPARVVDAMAGLKLAPLPGDRDELFPLDQRFEGELKGKRVLVSALYDPAGRLEKVLVAFLTPDEECAPLFRTLKQELRQQYGTPVVDVERWDFPYGNGGHLGQEHYAIRLGRGMMATAWDSDDAGSTDGGVSLMTTGDVIVRLAYESSRWAAESERRKKILGATSQGPSAAPAAPVGDGRDRISGGLSSR